MRRRPQQNHIHIRRFRRIQIRGCRSGWHGNCGNSPQRTDRSRGARHGRSRSGRDRVLQTIGNINSVCRTRRQQRRVHWTPPKPCLTHVHVAHHIYLQDRAGNVAVGRVVRVDGHGEVIQLRIAGVARDLNDGQTVILAATQANGPQRQESEKRKPTTNLHPYLNRKIAQNPAFLE